MKKTNLKTYIFSVLILLVTGFMLTGCSKDDESPSLSTKNVKVTFSVSSTFNKETGSIFDLAINGGVILSNGTVKTVDWKVNGVNSVGTTTIGSDFVNGGKSNVVVESAEPISSGVLSIGVAQAGSTAGPFTLTYKVEFGGNIIDEKTVIMTTDSDVFSKSYNF